MKNKVPMRDHVMRLLEKEKMLEAMHVIKDLESHLQASREEVEGLRGCLTAIHDLYVSYTFGSMPCSTMTAMFNIAKEALGGGDEPDLTKCPTCGGEADNGFDRCIPPSPYECSKCQESEDETTDF